jgi:hypothetical protein
MKPKTVAENITFCFIWVVKSVEFSSLRFEPVNNRILLCYNLQLPEVVWKYECLV